MFVFLTGGPFAETYADNLVFDTPPIGNIWAWLWYYHQEPLIDFTTNEYRRRVAGQRTEIRGTILSV